MKIILEHINKAFENRTRLGIMAALLVNDSVDFNTLKEILNVTDGNLASHIKALVKLDYIIVMKQFIGNKPNTNYSATKLGKLEFQKHLNALEKLINAQ